MQIESGLRVHVQPKGSKGEIDIYRIDQKRGIHSHETFPGGQREAEIVLQNRTSATLNNIRESEIYLGVNVATAVILFLGALRYRSKLLMTAGLVSGVTAIYANQRRTIHINEHNWLEKEGMALEKHDDNFS